MADPTREADLAAPATLEPDAAMAIRTRDSGDLSRRVPQTNPFHLKSSWLAGGPAPLHRVADQSHDRGTDLGRRQHVLRLGDHDRVAGHRFQYGIVRALHDPDAASGPNGGQPCASIIKRARKHDADHPPTKGCGAPKKNVDGGAGPIDARPSADPYMSVGNLQVMIGRRHIEVAGAYRIAFSRNHGRQAGLPVQDRGQGGLLCGRQVQHHEHCRRQIGG